MISSSSTMSTDPFLAIRLSVFSANFMVPQRSVSVGEIEAKKKQAALMAFLLGLNQMQWREDYFLVTKSEPRFKIQNSKFKIPNPKSAIPPSRQPTVVAFAHARGLSVA